MGEVRVVLVVLVLELKKERKRDDASGLTLFLAHGCSPPQTYLEITSKVRHQSIPFDVPELNDLPLHVDLGLGVRVDERPDEREESVEDEGSVLDVSSTDSVGVVVGHHLEDLLQERRGEVDDERTKARRDGEKERKDDANLRREGSRGSLALSSD